MSSAPIDPASAAQLVQEPDHRLRVPAGTPVPEVDRPPSPDRPPTRVRELRPAPRRPDGRRDRRGVESPARSAEGGGGLDLDEGLRAAEAGNPQDRDGGGMGSPHRAGRRVRLGGIDVRG